MTTPQTRKSVCSLVILKTGYFGLAGRKLDISLVGEMAVVVVLHGELLVVEGHHDVTRVWDERPVDDEQVAAVDACSVHGVAVGTCVERRVGM